MTLHELPRCDEPLEKLCHRCGSKPSCDGRLARGYSADRETCDGCGHPEFVCLFRPPAAVCAACGNHIQVEPAECRNDACENTYCIICAPKWLRADGSRICVPCIVRFQRVPIAQFFGALRLADEQKDAAIAETTERAEQLRLMAGAFGRTG